MNSASTIAVAPHTRASSIEKYGTVRTPVAGWARTLAPREQDFLVAMLRAAGGVGDDTTGHVLAMTVLTLVPSLQTRHDHDTPKNAINNTR